MPQRAPGQAAWNVLERFSQELDEDGSLVQRSTTLSPASDQ